MNVFDKFRKSGITQKTPKSLLLNAAVLYKSLKYIPEEKKWSGVLLGATSGGTKVNISSDYQEIEVDGAIVKVVGLTQKQGESGSIEANLVEVTEDNLKMAIVGKESESDIEGYDLIETKALLEASDYIDNIAAVGTLSNSNGRPVIVIMENMLCTSGLEIDTKNKKNAVMKVKFECHAGFDDDHDTLPIRIYYPKETAAQQETLIYTQPDLEAMTVTQIEALADERGYTLTGANKEEKIQSFLEQQSGGNA
jgi:hypothetical protein